MSKLRRRMEEDMRIRNLSPTTRKRYLDRVAAFAAYFNKSPDLPGAGGNSGFSAASGGGKKAQFKFR